MHSYFYKSLNTNYLTYYNQHQNVYAINSAIADLAHSPHLSLPRIRENLLLPIRNPLPQEIRMLGVSRSHAS